MPNRRSRGPGTAARIGQGVLGAAALSAAALLLPAAAQAQDAGDAAAAGQPGFLAGLWTQSTLLGDMGGLRSTLGRYGITLGLQETSEVLGNVSGGTRQGAEYDGLTTLTLDADLQKALGWTGGTFHLSALQIHGRNLSADDLDTLQAASGIEAKDSTRLWELWYQQALPGGKADVRVGQQSIDQEFMVSAYSSLFMNAAMGWPVLPAADLYAGGPAYPLSAPGIRLHVQATDSVSVLAGVFDDNPPGGPFAADSELRGAERAGVKFNLDNGALFIGELQYAVNQPASGAGASDPAPSGLPGTYKLGVWYDTAAFPDQQDDSNGLSLASPNSNGIPAARGGNFSVYALADQMVWRAGGKDPQAVGLFARVMGAPSDRNLVSASFDAGVSLKAPLPGRDNDTFGIGYGMAEISSAARALDREEAAAAGNTSPIGSSEQFIEVTYQIQLAPWWQLQPDFQYVFNPGGGVVDPDNPARTVGNEAILGLRTNITF